MQTEIEHENMYIHIHKIQKNIKIKNTNKLYIIITTVITM